jgi:hypothetical protein
MCRDCFWWRTGAVGPRLSVPVSWNAMSCAGMWRDSGSGDVMSGAPVTSVWPKMGVQGVAAWRFGVGDPGVPARAHWDSLAVSAASCIARLTDGRLKMRLCASAGARKFSRSGGGFEKGEEGWISTTASAGGLGISGVIVFGVATRNVSFIRWFSLCGGCSVAERVRLPPSGARRSPFSLKLNGKRDIGAEGLG